MNEWTLALSAAAFVLVLLSLILLLRLIKRQPDYERLLRESWSANLPALKTELTGELRASRGELTGTVQTTMKTFADSLALAQTQTAERQDVRLRELIESLEKNQLQLKSTIAETNRILAEAQEKQFAMQDKRMQGIEAQFTAFTAAVQSRLETEFSRRPVREGVESGGVLRPLEELVLVDYDLAWTVEHHDSILMSWAFYLGGGEEP